MPLDAHRLRHNLAESHWQFLGGGDDRAHLVEVLLLMVDAIDNLAQAVDVEPLAGYAFGHRDEIFELFEHRVDAEGLVQVLPLPARHFPPVGNGWTDDRHFERNAHGT